MSDTLHELFPITTLQDLCYYLCFTETKIEVQGSKVYSQGTHHWRKQMRFKSRSIQCPYLSFSPSAHKNSVQSERYSTSEHAIELSPVRVGRNLRGGNHRSLQCWVTEQNSGKNPVSLQTSTVWKETKIIVIFGLMPYNHHHQGSLWTITVAFRQKVLNNWNTEYGY